MIGIIVLAGGQGRRMGGQDKGWCLHENRPCIELILTQMEAQISALKATSNVYSTRDFKIFISANRHLYQYHALGFDVITDERVGYCGPLAGVESVMNYQGYIQQRSAASSPIERWITCPVDSPKLPQTYLKQMLNLETQQVAYAEQKSRKHFAHLSIPAAQADAVGLYLDSGQRSIKHWLFQPAFESLITAVRFDCAESNLLNLNTLNTKQGVHPKVG